MNDEINLFHFISWQIKTLKYLGIWFRIQPVNKIKFFIIISTKIIILIVAFIIPAGGQLVYLSRLIFSGKAQLQEVAGIINLILTELLIIIKLFHLYCNRINLYKLMDSRASSRLVEKSLKCRLFSVHLVVAPALRRFRVLPVKMDFVYIDVNDEPYFKYVFIYQILYKPVIVLTFVALKTLSWSCIIFASNQLDNLRHNIKNMNSSLKNFMKKNSCDKNFVFKEVFKNCVKHHNYILSFVELIQETFGGQFSLTLIFNACIICSTSVQFFSIQCPSNNISEFTWVFAFMFIFAMILYVDSYYGDAITTKNFAISEAIYSYPWVNLSPQLKRNVQLFIGKTQVPLVIKTSILVPVSLDTFTKVMNWTYKGFAVLNQMKA
ncbi:odorant receptor 49a-like, partial [Papilio machaon]|uniref:odorant receptor 49a-like n=1 Tax=Papilio machaon TaxID=76193 RepID=UPI001E6654C8